MFSLIKEQHFSNSPIIPGKVTPTQIRNSLCATGQVVRLLLGVLVIGVLELEFLAFHVGILALGFDEEIEQLEVLCSVQGFSCQPFP
jgi:hypothetical protein